MDQECLVQSGEVCKASRSFLGLRLLRIRLKSDHGEGAENFPDRGNIEWEGWHGGPSEGHANPREKVNMPCVMESHGKGTRGEGLVGRASVPLWEGLWPL